MKKGFWLFVLGIVIFTFGVAPAWAANWLQGIQSINQGASTAGGVVNTMKSIGSMIPKNKAKAQAEDDSEITSEEGDNEEEADVPKPIKKKKKKQKASKSNDARLTKTTNPIRGTWGTQVTCEGPNTATCQNGMDDLVNCMHQTKGYYYRLVANNLENKLRSDVELSDEEREEMEADIAAVKDAIESGKVVDPDLDSPQRWLDHLSEEDQQEINSMNTKYMKEVRNDCDARFGGMPR